ncbi:MAG: molybdopterin molybdotransferase MoeA [Ignavibacteria bacterium]|nr:molybdopterin molybdotransferase MoeA [Ignavibacteria bacterium]
MRLEAEKMVSVSEAKKLIIENCDSPKTVELPLLEANGLILAEAVYSLIDTPPFNQSAMDGYAFSFDDWDKESGLNLTGEIQTGDHSERQLGSNETIRIFTGGAVPAGADTVIMQEKIKKDNNVIYIQDENIAKGNNVRLKGSQTKKGEISLRQSQLLTPAGISFLTGIGITSVKVFSKPAVSIIVTGKELTKAGNEISEGKIYESNSVGLVAALNQTGISPESVEIVDDVLDEIKNVVSKQLKSDILILTGGVSVGDYDLVPDALEQCGVKKIFHKVKQKPGKPFFFGVHEQTLVFALPGNPAAVMSCFYQYIVPAVSSFTQKNYFRKLKLPLADDYSKKPGLTYFLKGKTGEQDVSILKSQESYMMDTFAVADCLVELPEEKEYFSKGDPVNISMII